MYKCGELRFDMPDSSGVDGLRRKRTILVSAAPAEDPSTVTLVLANRQGLIYGSEKMQEGKLKYSFEYSGKGEVLCIYAVTTVAATSYIDIYALSTAYYQGYTNVISPVSKTIQAVNGQNIQLYFATIDNPQTNGYTYTITYDSSKL